jgi:hypothetical protein
VDLKKNNVSKKSSVGEWYVSGAVVFTGGCLAMDDFLWVIIQAFSHHAPVL